MGLLQILANPKMLHAGQALGTINAVRVDYDKANDDVVLSLVIGKRVRCYRAPCKCTATPAEILPVLMAIVDELLEDLAGGPVCQAVAEIPPTEPPAPTT